MMGGNLGLGLPSVRNLPLFRWDLVKETPFAAELFERKGRDVLLCLLMLAERRYRAAAGAFSEDVEEVLLLGRLDQRVGL